VFGQRDYWSVTTAYLKHTRGVGSESGFPPSPSPCTPLAQTKPAVSRMQNIRGRIFPVMRSRRVHLICSCVCLSISICRRMYVCLFAYNSKTGEAIVSKFSGFWVVSRAKFGGRVIGRGQKIGIFRFSRDRPAMRHGRQTAHCDGHLTGYRRAHRRRRTRSRRNRNMHWHAYYTRVWKAGALGGRNKRNVAVYVIPDYAGRMAST